jgi:predicted hydrolase (HD superfamily)
MADHIPARVEALVLLKEYTSNESLLKHALAVEAVMRHVARAAGEPEDTWGVVGLVHDLDYECFPDRHCTKTREIPEEQHWPESDVRAVVSHGWGLCTDVEPLSPLEKTLHAVDELVGFVTACALVRPSRSVRDLKAPSVRKKWKEKRFAAGVNREVIQKGADLLNTDLDSLIGHVIAGMREVASGVGL